LNGSNAAGHLVKTDPLSKEVIAAKDQSQGLTWIQKAAVALVTGQHYLVSIAVQAVGTGANNIRRWLKLFDQW
jgi:hypothetical protein